MAGSILTEAVRRKMQRERKRKRIGMGKFTHSYLTRMRKRRVVAIGAWNTRQLGAANSKFDQYLKFKHLSQLWEKRGWEIVILTDTKWGRHATFEIEGHEHTWTVISRGKVSIALKPKWAQAWRDSRTVVHTDGREAHRRVIMIQIQCFRKLGFAIAGIYSPSSKAKATEVEEHLGDVNKVLSKCRPRFILVAGGDFNAEAESRTADSGNTLGPHGWRTCNHRGQKLLELCVDNDLVDTHSWTPQRNKATWKHPRFKTEHLIDHFFVARVHGRNVQRTLTQHTELIQEYQLHDWTEYTDHKPIELRINLAPPLS